MMKKFTKATLLLAAGALLLAGLPACSDDDDGGVWIPETKPITGVSVSPDHVSVEEGKTATLTATVEPEDATNKTVHWAVTGEDDVVEITDKGDGTATVKGVKKGETKITVTTEDGGFEKEVSVTVYAEGWLVKVESVSISADKTEIEVDGTAKITATIEPEGATDKNLMWSAEPEERAKLTENEDGTVTVTGKTAGTVTITATASNNVKSNGLEIEVKAEEVTGTTYAWDFQAADLKDVLGSSPLEAEGTYESTPAGLTLVFPKGLQYNQLDPNATVSSSVTVAGMSNGIIQPRAGDDGDMYVEVKGPFTTTMIYSSNASTDKKERTAYIKIGSEEAASATPIPAKGGTLTAKYDGTDTVKVSFGATNYVRVYDIQITTANGDGAGKTAGEVKSSAVFVPQTDDTTANDEATLGLVGASADSSDTSVATAKVEGGKVKITSVSAGTAIITVKDSSGNKATIEVTVGSTGIITIGKITKYRAPTDMSKATVLINYPAKKDGITLTTPASNGPEYTTVKIHTNKDDVNCLSFKGSGVDKGVILSVNGGFKAGDEIEIAGVFNNADDKKQAAVAISNGGDTLFTTKDFINGRNIADDPESETYVLEADAESLVLSRSGNTATNITLLKVTRPSAE